MSLTDALQLVCTLTKSLHYFPLSVKWYCSYLIRVIKKILWMLRQKGEKHMQYNVFLFFLYFFRNTVNVPFLNHHRQKTDIL